jgi:hypothetical protein
MTTLEELLEKARHVKMTPEQKRAQAISFAANNVAIDRPEYDLWLLYLGAAKAYDKRREHQHPRQHE